MVQIPDEKYAIERYLRSSAGDDEGNDEVQRDRQSTFQSDIPSELIELSLLA
jgi:hypothetical protein